MKRATWFVVALFTLNGAWAATTTTAASTTTITTTTGSTSTISATSTTTTMSTTTTVTTTTTTTTTSNSTPPKTTTPPAKSGNSGNSGNSGGGTSKSNHSGLSEGHELAIIFGSLGGFILLMAVLLGVVRSVSNRMRWKQYDKMFGGDSELDRELNDIIVGEEKGRTSRYLEFDGVQEGKSHEVRPL